MKRGAIFITLYLRSIVSSPLKFIVDYLTLYVAKGKLLWVHSPITVSQGYHLMISLENM